jgi:TRAP-type C4-dicarboxylate transport system permease small subunit
MAASKGKHINIDLATRYIPLRLAPAVAIVGWLAAALVCFVGAYGFVDSIAVTKFRAEAFRSCSAGVCETTVSERWAKAAEGMSSDFFLLRRQLALDVRSLPHVIAGRRYDEYLTAAEWNAWLDAADWAAHFPKEAVAGMRADESNTALRKVPAVIAPDTGEGVGLLIRDLDFVLPMGLLAIGLKFLLRVLRVLSGHVRVDPAAAHDDEDLKVGHDALPPEKGAKA